MLAGLHAHPVAKTFIGAAQVLHQDLLTCQQNCTHTLLQKHSLVLHRCSTKTCSHASNNARTPCCKKLSLVLHRCCTCESMVLANEKRCRTSESVTLAPSRDQLSFTQAHNMVRPFCAQAQAETQSAKPLLRKHARWA
jgi:hypothetical protein